MFFLALAPPLFCLDPENEYGAGEKAEPDRIYFPHDRSHGQFTITPSFNFYYILTSLARFSVSLSLSLFTLSRRSCTFVFPSLRRDHRFHPLTKSYIDLLRTAQARSGRSDGAGYASKCASNRKIQFSIAKKNNKKHLQKKNFNRFQKKDCLTCVNR